MRRILGAPRSSAPSLELGGYDGNFSYYLTGLYLQSNLGFSSAVAAPDPIHDAVRQGAGIRLSDVRVESSHQIESHLGNDGGRQSISEPGQSTAEFELDHVNPVLHPSSAIDSSLSVANC
jgi:hypothetical protein